MPIFEKGHQGVTGKRQKTQLADMIRERLEKEKDSLTNRQFSALTFRLAKLTSRPKKRATTRSGRAEERREKDHSFLSHLSPAEQEEFRIIFAIEAERLAAGKKAWADAHPELVGKDEG